MKISLLHWNIWVKEDPANILSLLKILKPDIVCLQELTTNSPRMNHMDVPGFLANSLSYHSAVFETTSKTKQGVTYAQLNGIFSRFPLQNSQSRIVQTTDASLPSYSGEQRVAGFTDIVIDEKILRVGTTHLSYTHKFQATPSKVAEGKKVIEALDELQPDIFTGDLNATENSQLITDMEKRLVNAGPDYREKTWTTKPFSYDGFDESKLKWRLDYVFVKPDIKVISSQIIRTEYSDHLPILIELELPVR
jgi:endonuclease/exonuclease/phosphatase family metal-dependent hydrolase